MAHEYLMKEYELCFEQLRFYDERYESILKYTFSLTSAVATAQFAIYKLMNGPTAGFFRCLVFLSGIVFVATLLLFMAMLQNRLYFVYVARQLNAIRAYLMRVDAGGFRNNQMYVSTNFPALKPFSVHSFQLLGTALISSAFAGLCAYAISPAMGYVPFLCAGLAPFILIFGAEVSGGMTYLHLSDKRRADEAVHLQEGVEPHKQTHGNES